jgi:hypothetical protein
MYNDAMKPKMNLGNKNGYKHGLSRHPIYNIWHGMHSRCKYPSNPMYKYYGGRGIRVCDRWKDVALFYEDMGARPEGKSLDRIDNDGNYEPSNCRWATPKEQNRNSRRAHMITYQGETMCMFDWADRAGINRNTFSRRINGLGWSIQRAMTTPASTRGLGSKRNK